jgi:hypothetical protein
VSDCYPLKVSGITSPATVPDGGTGATSLTDHGVLVGSGTGAVTPLSVGATGTYLRGATGADPGWSTLTLPNTATQGDLLVATAANVIGSLADVAVNNVLLSGGVGVAPSWGPVPNAALSFSSITFADGTGISGAATVALGGTYTPAVNQATAFAWTAAHSLSLAVATAQTPGVTLQTLTAATVGAQKYSAGLELKGFGWGTTAGTSQAEAWLLQCRPVQGTTPTADLVFWRSDSGGAYTERLAIQFNNAASNLLDVKGGHTDVRFVNSTSGGLYAQGAATQLLIAGTAHLTLTASALYPTTDKALTLGLSTNRWKRLWLAGTTPTDTSFALSAGWGATASVGTITGDDNHWRATVTTAGAGLGANPTIAYTFKDGTYTNVPFCRVSMEASSDGTVTAPWMTYTATATVLTITFHGLPVVGNTYVIEAHTVGG